AILQAGSVLPCECKSLLLLRDNFIQDLVCDYVLLLELLRRECWFLKLLSPPHCFGERLEVWVAKFPREAEFGQAIRKIGELCVLFRRAICLRDGEQFGAAVKQFQCLGINRGTETKQRAF